MRSFILICVISAVYGEHRHVRQNSGCGVPAYTPHTPPSRLAKIVGGREAVPHSWPWQAVLRFRDHSLTCGGSLIRTSTGELVVITAGQCVDGTLSSEWKVDVGVHSRSAMESNQKTYDVREIVSHENFNPYLLENDIAIVRLTTNVTENEAVKPICITTLPTSDFYGNQCVVTGWGATVEGGEPNDRLKEVYKPVLTDTECQTNIGGSFNGTIMLCAGYLQGGQGACAGDNGGPLSCKNANGQYDLIGLVSWGFGCAREGFPAVYADVHYYLDWINSHITAN